MNKRNEEVKVSKGVRRHNASGKHGTINQNIARSNPKFTSLGSGIIQHIKSNDVITRGIGNKWESVSKSMLSQKKPESKPPISPPEKDVVIL